MQQERIPKWAQDFDRAQWIASGGMWGWSEKLQRHIPVIPGADEGISVEEALARRPLAEVTLEGE